MFRFIIIFLLFDLCVERIERWYMRYLIRGPQFQARFQTKLNLLLRRCLVYVCGCVRVYYRSYRNYLAQRGRTPYPVCDGLWQEERYIQTRGYRCAYEQFQTERRLSKQHATVIRPRRRFHRRHILIIKCIYIYLKYMILTNTCFRTIAFVAIYARAPTQNLTDFQHSTVLVVTIFGQDNELSAYFVDIQMGFINLKLFFIIKLYNSVLL